VIVELRETVGRSLKNPGGGKGANGRIWRTTVSIKPKVKRRAGSQSLCTRRGMTMTKARPATSIKWEMRDVFEGKKGKDQQQQTDEYRAFQAENRRQKKLVGGSVVLGVMVRCRRGDRLFRRKGKKKSGLNVGNVGTETEGRCRQTGNLRGGQWMDSRSLDREKKGT